MSEHGYRICTICGAKHSEGFYLTDAYCCCEECRNEYYKRAPYNCTSDDDALREYLWECHDLDHQSEVTHDEWMKKPIDECLNFTDRIGDIAFFTTWY